MLVHFMLRSSLWRLLSIPSPPSHPTPGPQPERPLSIMPVPLNIGCDSVSHRSFPTPQHMSNSAIAMPCTLFPTPRQQPLCPSLPCGSMMDIGKSRPHCYLTRLLAPRLWKPWAPAEGLPCALSTRHGTSRPTLALSVGLTFARRCVISMLFSGMLIKPCPSPVLTFSSIMR